MLYLKKLTALFMGAILVGGTVGANATTTASAVTYVTATHAVGLTFAGGPGHTRSVWAGTWNNGVRGFCLDFGKSTANRSGRSVIAGNIPGMTAEESKQAKFIANKYSLTESREAAANAGLAVWRYQHDSAFNTWYKSARARGVITTARHNAVDAIILDARQHFDYKITVDTITKVHVGQKGHGTVKVLGSNGRPAVGRSVLVGVSNGKILTVNGVAGTRGTTQATGVVFTYQRTTTSTVYFKATITAPSSAKAGLSISSSGHQRTLSGGFVETDWDYHSYYLRVNAPMMATTCDTDCEGATITFRFPNPGAQAIKWTERIGARDVLTQSVKANTTITKSIRLKDGEKITTSEYCYTVRGVCTAAPVVLKTPYEIVCPAWAQAELKLPCNCTPNAPTSVTLTSPASSPRFYRGFVSVNGAVTPVNLVNGKPSTITIGRLGAGTKVVLSFRVYRDPPRTTPLLVMSRFEPVMRAITVN